MNLPDIPGDLERLFDTWDTKRAENRIEALSQGKPTHSMEHDILLTPEIVAKVREDDVYAQNLYAAMCNTQWQEQEVFPVLKDERWSCSWRSAGGIIADIRNMGNYMDWYCSGIQRKLTQEEFDGLTEDHKQHYLEIQAYVGEGVVTDEIRRDLASIGWVCVEEDGDGPV